MHNPFYPFLQPFLRFKIFEDTAMASVCVNGGACTDQMSSTACGRLEVAAETLMAS